MKACFLILIVLIGLPMVAHSAFYNSTFQKCISFNITNTETIGNNTYRLNLTSSQINFSDFAKNASEVIITNSTGCGYTSGDVIVPIYVQTFDGVRGEFYFTPSIAVVNNQFSLWFKNSTPVTNVLNSITTATIYGNNFDQYNNGDSIPGWTLTGSGRTNASSFSAVSGSMSMVFNNTAAAFSTATYKIPLARTMWVIFDLKLIRQADNQDFFDLSAGDGKRKVNLFQHCCGSGIVFQNVTSGTTTLMAAPLNKWVNVRMLINYTNTSNANFGYLFLNWSSMTKDNTSRVWGDDYAGGCTGEGFCMTTGGASANQTYYIDNLFMSRTSFNLTNYQISGIFNNTISDTCTPVTPLWQLNLADNCTISGNYFIQNIIFYSTGQGSSRFTNLNLTYSNLTYGSFIQWSTLIKDRNSILIKK